MLAVDAFASTMCSPYATPATVAANLKQDGAAYRQCYSWYGPNQPGVNEADPSNPGGCVPDPGGAPPGQTGPQTSAKACPPGALTLAPPTTPAKRSAKPNSNTGSGSASSPSVPIPNPAPTVQGALGAVTKALGGGVTTPSTPTPVPGVTVPGVTVPGVTTPTTPRVPLPQSPNTSSSGTPSAQQAQHLLNYLLSP